MKPVIESREPDEYESALYQVIAPNGYHLGFVGEHFAYADTLEMAEEMKAHPCNCHEACREARGEEPPLTRATLDYLLRLAMADRDQHARRVIADEDNGNLTVALDEAWGEAAAAVRELLDMRGEKR
jgi:hypothetical protein